MVANERSIVQVGPQALAPAHETDWDEVKRVLRGMVARNVTEPEVDAIIMVAKASGFNPVLGHLIPVDGKPYVTHKGLWNLAHRSGQLDGIEVLDQGETDTHYTARVAIYRKDMRIPFTFTGRYPKGGRNKQYGPEMALVRAECLALRRAFDVPIAVYEEINWQEQPNRGSGVTVREVAPTAPYDGDGAGEAFALHGSDADWRVAMGKPAQIAAPTATPGESRFVATVRQMGEDGVTVKEITDFINSEWERLTEAEQLAGTDQLDAIKDARRAAKAARQQQPAAPIEAAVASPSPIAVGPLGDDSQRATERQVKFILAIGREAGLDEHAVNTLARGSYGGDVDQLNRGDAALLIEELRRQRGEGYQRPEAEVAADEAILEDVPFD